LTGAVLLDGPALRLPSAIEARTPFAPFFAKRALEAFEVHSIALGKTMLGCGAFEGIYHLRNLVVTESIANLPSAEPLAQQIQRIGRQMWHGLGSFANARTNWAYKSNPLSPTARDDSKRGVINLPRRDRTDHTEWRKGKRLTTGCSMQGHDTLVDF